MGITVKKKKLTVKTQKAALADDSGVSENAEAKTGTSEIPGSTLESAATAQPAGGVPTAAPPIATVSAVKPASYTLAGTLAILAVIMFIALIVLQAMEWDFFKDAFPRTLPTGAPPAAPVALSPISPTSDLTPEPLDALDE